MAGNIHRGKPWSVATPMMVMPDGTERSFDTFTKEELQAWAKRAQRRAMAAAGYYPVEELESTERK